jgi:transcriptional regulator with XRE-family HTH domain
MLNVPIIKAAMRGLGLNGAKLADACGVSREAASNWLAGESMPRPSKLSKLAEVLNLSVDSLLEAGTDTVEPVFAYRTKQNRAVSGASRIAAEELARHMRQLLPFLELEAEFEPQQVKDPVLDDAHLRRVAHQVRESVGLAAIEPISVEQLIGLFHKFKAVLVPVLWGLNKEHHENALSVYLPDTKTSFVVFNLGGKVDDFKYWLAHEYGHCLSLHKLRDEDGEKYAERFAQFLVFPEAAEHECLAAIRGTCSSHEAMLVAHGFATRYGVSIVTILKGVDRCAEEAGEAVTGLIDGTFWASWKTGRKRVPSVSLGLFGTDSPKPDVYVAKAESVYASPVFKALARFQREDGGRNPAFIANALKIGIGDAAGLSYALWDYA